MVSILGSVTIYPNNSVLPEISTTQRKINTNPPNIANQDNSIPTTLMALSNTMPLSVLDANKYNAAGNEYSYSRFLNRTNPYWVLAEQFHNIKRDRIFGNLTVKYNILPGFLYRVVLDRIIGAATRIIIIFLPVMLQVRRHQLVL